MKASDYSETKRDPVTKRWVKGTPQRAGPGRKPLAASEHLFAAARMLADQVSKDAVDAVTLARQCSPHAIARAVDIALHSTDEGVALDACELLLNRAFGLPSQAIAAVNFNMRDDVSPAERQERVRLALDNLRAQVLAKQPRPFIEGEQS